MDSQAARDAQAGAAAPAGGKQRANNHRRRSNNGGATSPAPSLLSMASSGSPLVRAGSSMSASSSTTTASSASASSTSSSSSSSARPHGGRSQPVPTTIAAAQLQCQQQLGEFAHNKLAAHLGRSAAPERDRAEAAHKRKQKEMQSAGGPPHGAKSLGYNLAKSLAFRANR